VSAPHCIHLLAADSGVAKSHRYGTYIALCHALLSASSLPAALCADDGDCEVAYCSDCLRAAAEVNADAGLASITPGTMLMMESSPSQRPDPVQ